MFNLVKNMNVSKSRESLKTKEIADKINNLLEVDATGFENSALWPISRINKGFQICRG